MTRTIPEPLLRQLSDFIAERLGLSFPPERWNDLERGVLSAARESNHHALEPFVRQLLSSTLSRSRIEILASCLTVGETYFFRDALAFEALEKRVLPELIRARGKAGKRLRIWSAGCSTGEEAYSIAITVRRLIPDPRDWNITILGTDVNPAFLKKASIGAYGEWSFRDCPAWVKETYFAREGDGLYHLNADIKRMVGFAHVNLAEDSYPCLLNNTNALDLVFCRNVLMYFTPDRARKAVEGFYNTLVVGGWIFVSPTEASRELFSRFSMLPDGGTILIRKDERAAQPAEIRAGDVSAYAVQPFLDAVFEPDEEEPFPAQPEPAGGDSTDLREPTEARVLARGLADRGMLEEAREQCEKALEADKLDPGLHYLRAMILRELGAMDEAVVSLKRALYLDPNFSLAHFSLGCIARTEGMQEKAAGHFRTALSILGAYTGDEIVPVSDGMTAARLREVVAAMMESGGP